MRKFLKLMLDDFVSTPIANTATIVVMVFGLVLLSRGDLHGWMLAMVISSQYQLGRKRS